MDKIKTSKKQKKSSPNTLKAKVQLKIKKGVKVKKFNPDQYLSADFIGAAIMECLLNNDPEGIVELLTIYMEEHNKVELLKKAHVPRSTIYQAFRHKNPTIKTLAKIVSAVAIH